MQVKSCTVCHRTLPVQDFKKSRQPPICKPCANAANQRWRKRNPELYAAASKRSRLVKYDLSVVEYDAMLLAQDHKCLICLQPETKTHPNGTLCELAVDHDHATGKVRGLLCNRCNRGVGNFRDDPSTCERAADYIRSHQ